MLALPLLVTSVASAQQIPLGRVLVVDGVSAALMPLNPPPGLVEPLTVPDQFRVSALMVSVSSTDSLVDSFHITTRVETASGARMDFSGTVKRDPGHDWVTEIFYTGKGRT